MLHRGIKTTKEPYDNGPLTTVKSVLRVMPRKDHDNTTFTCQSQNMADRSPQSAKLRVEVRTSNLGLHVLAYTSILTIALPVLEPELLRVRNVQDNILK